jgi:hypothetical protein
MKLLRMPIGPGQGDTVSHGKGSWLVNNQSGIVALPDFVADFMLEDKRSGGIEVTDPPGDGELIECPCCHFRFRRQPKEKEE